MDFQRWIKVFKWESEVQEKSFLHFTQWVRSLPVGVVCEDGPRSLINCLAAFIFQKTHESNEWWRETMASQLGQLQAELGRTQEELRQVKLRCAKLEISNRSFMGPG